MDREAKVPIHAAQVIKEPLDRTAKIKEQFPDTAAEPHDCESHHWKSIEDSFSIECQICGAIRPDDRPADYEY